MRTAPVAPRTVAPFLPLEPKTLAEAGLSESDLEALVVKYLLNVGTGTGRKIADHLMLPAGIVAECLLALKAGMLVSYKSLAQMGDFVYELTDAGVDRARRYAERCTYFGAAPVPLEAYIDGISRQAVGGTQVTVDQLRQAFADLNVKREVIVKLGEAVTAGKGLFLYGSPGNGKTSIAERITAAYGDHMWIPRTIGINGEMIRLFDPSNHEVLPTDAFAEARFDRRWVYIRRPTIVVGGELKLEHLDIRFNAATGILEAPVHMKCNGGTFVVDDFGRQRVSTDDLLNRWIVPLEKRVDYLGLPSGRQIEVPFELLLVLSTNLEPRDLVDEAFLRRIPYKIEVKDPTEAEFHELFQTLAKKLNVRHSNEAVEYLIQHHFRAAGRAMRYCHARDLLLQVVTRCKFLGQSAELTPQSLDLAVDNYFAVM